MNLKEKALWLSEFYVEVAKGKTIQTRGSHDEVWRNAPPGAGPSFGCDLDHWRTIDKPVNVKEDDIAVVGNGDVYVSVAFVGEENRLVKANIIPSGAPVIIDFDDIVAVWSKQELTK